MYKIKFENLKLYYLNKLSENTLFIYTIRLNNKSLIYFDILFNFRVTIM